MTFCLLQNQWFYTSELNITVLDLLKCAFWKFLTRNEVANRGSKVSYKKESFRIKSHEDSEGGWNVALPSLLWHSAQLGWQSRQLHAPATIYPKKILLFLLLFEVEWNPRLLNADGKNSSLENFQGPYRESNPEAPASGKVPHPTVPLAPSLIYPVTCVLYSTDS